MSDFGRRFRARGDGWGRRAAILAALASVLASSLPALPSLAHEMGSGRVEVTFVAGERYVVELRLDPEATLAKLRLADADSGRRAAAGAASADGEDLEALLLARREQLLASMDLRFDGRAVAPDLELAVVEAAAPSSSAVSETDSDAAALLRQLAAQSAQEAVLRLRGDLPPGAHAFTWSWSLPSTAYALIVRDERHGTVATEWLEGGAASAPFDLDGVALSRFAVARRYVVLGFTHIVPKGLDHILFVLGIFLLCTRLRPVLAQVTAFTVAHTLTLGLSIYGVVSLPSTVVEPLIALSIVYVAVENVMTRDLSRWRVVVVFCFGLLHGLGFAGVLEALGLPRSQLLTALASFNVGVELGQLAVIGLAFLLVASWSRQRPWYRQRVVVPASLAIAAVGFVWTVQRVLL